MLSRSTVMRSATVLIIAAATGHFMQNGGALASKLSPGQDVTPTPSLVSGIPLPPTVLSQPMSLPRAPASLPGRIASLATPTGPNVQDDVGHTPFKFACSPSAMITALPRAELAVSFTAACHPNQRVTVAQDDLKFSAVTNSEGVLAFTMPALSTQPEVTMTLADGTLQKATAHVADAGTRAYSVLQWQDDKGLFLHAYQPGAKYGGPGHLTVNAQNAFLSAGPEGSYMAQYGEDTGVASRFVQVFSMPNNAWDEILFEIEAVVTDKTCGSDLTAQVTQYEAGQKTKAVDMIVSMPACSAIGEAVILPDPFATTLLAAN